MHELGVVYQIAESVLKIAEENEAVQIYSVTLELGRMSSVVPEYLTDLWGWYCENEPLLKGSELKIEQIPAVSRCRDCERDYDMMPQGRICPYCGGHNTEQVSGNEFNIKEIIVE